MPANKPDKHRCDAFICHASEDKYEFAKPLAQALRKEGVEVWFDEFEIKLGESIAGRIEGGLAQSKVGIIVLSPAALSKGWTNYESNALRQLHINRHATLILRLAVLHACFIEIMRDTLEDWIGSFCHDYNYELEIKCWERMAACYLRCVVDRHYKPEIKRKIFEILLGLFSGADHSDVEKGFRSLQDGAGKRLYIVVSDWVEEWRDKLRPLKENELSDENDVQNVIVQGVKSLSDLVN